MAAPRQYNVQAQSYTDPQQRYNQNSRGYAERPSDMQRQHYHNNEPMQRLPNNGYAQPSSNYGTEDGLAEDNGFDGHRVNRLPPARFPAGDPNRPVKRTPMQQLQPRPVDTRQRAFQGTPAPRSAGPYQESNGFHTEVESHLPHQFHGRRPQHDEGANSDYEYAKDTGYIGYSHGDNEYALNHDGYRPYNVQKTQQHHRGYSDGFYQRNEAGPPNRPRDLDPTRPIHERTNERANGGLEKQKRRVFEDPMSPDTLSWDNPFPTFPAAKKRGGQPETSLNGGMADMTLRGGAGDNGDNRPQTSGGRSNNNMSRPIDGMHPTTGNYSPVVDAHFPKEQAFHNGRSQSRQRAYDEHNPNSGTFEAQHHDAVQNGSRPHMGPGRNAGKSQQNPMRPDPPVGRRSEEPPRAIPLHSSDFNGPDSGRSRTMPSHVSEAVTNPQGQRGNKQPPAWQNPQNMAGSSGLRTRDYQSERPATASGVRSTGPGPTRSGEVSHLRAEQTRSPHNNGGQNNHQKAIRPPVHQDSIADLYDSYYDTSSPKQPNHTHQSDANWQPPLEEDMPNFDAVPLPSNGHQRGMTIDDHMSPRVQSPEMPPMPAQYRQGDPTTFGPGTRSRQLMHSKSQPDLSNRRVPRTQQDDGFDFGIPQAHPAMPHVDHSISQTAPTSSRQRQDYDRRQALTESNQRQPPAPYRSNRDPRFGDPYSSSSAGARSYNPSPQQHHNQQPSERYRTDIEGTSTGVNEVDMPNQAQPDRYRSPNGQNRAPSNRPSPAAGGGPTSPPPMKPDALPAHPAPVRPGLMQSSSPNQPPKPAPVRNYNNNASPLQESNVMQPPPSTQRPNSQSTAPRLSSNDLEKLRTVAKSDPSDQKAQMNLAKGLVQAANGLEEFAPQSDQKARNKIREKYFSEAYKIVKRLVSTGYPDAMFFLGDCYSQGRLGLEKDSKEAFTLYQGAAKAGHAQAAFRVAVCCELGLEEDGGTKRDLGKAVQWYKRAATLGDTPAMYKTGVIQLKGLLGQPKDPGEAVVWLRKAAEKADKDNPHALHELALWHEAASGSGKIAGDEAYAKQLFVQAAELGYKFSQYRLGRACEYGLMGCPIDPRLSISWYSKAAVQEEHQSELALSGWYLTGAEGVLQQSDTEAYLWARKAATAGLAKAEFAMGYFTEVGIGCPPSSEEAKRWYWRAASQNFPKARERLEELRKGGAKMKKERVSRSAMKQESECLIM